MTSLFVRLLPLLMGKISPNIKLLIRAFVVKLEIDAKKTPNPWDDVLVYILKIIVNKH